MPRHYPPEFRQRAGALVRAGKSICRVAAELDISESGLHNRVRQDRIARSKSRGLTTPGSTEPTKDRKRIHQLETEVKILKRDGTAR